MKKFFNILVGPETTTTPIVWTITNKAGEIQLEAKAGTGACQKVATIKESGKIALHRLYDNTLCECLSILPGHTIELG